MSSSIAVGSRPGSSRSRCSWSGCSQQGEQAVPADVDRRLVPGVEQQDAGGDQLVLGQPVALGVADLHQVGEQVLAGGFPAIGGQRRAGRRRTRQRPARRRPRSAVVRPYSYIFTIALDQGRSSGRSASGHAEQLGDDGDRQLLGHPASRTSTGSVPPDRSTRPSTSRPASSCTHGRSRSTWPRANAVLISRRSRVWSGGSISRIALRWMRLKLLEPLGRLLVPPDPAQPPVPEDGVGLRVGERQPQPQTLVPLHRRRRRGRGRTTGTDRRPPRGRPGRGGRSRGHGSEPRGGVRRRPYAPGMASRKRSAAPAAAPEGINPKAPCPCGSGRRYKHCHGSGYAPPVTRPFEGLPGEADWVALRELVSAATATLRTTDGRDVTLASVLPGGTPALVRANGEILLGVQMQTSSDDVSRDIGTALAAALEAPAGTPVDRSVGPPRPARACRSCSTSAPRSRSSSTTTSGSGSRAPTPDAAALAGLEHANEAILPTVRLSGPRRRVLGAPGQRARPPALGAPGARGEAARRAGPALGVAEQILLGRGHPLRRSLPCARPRRPRVGPAGRRPRRGLDRRPPRSSRRGWSRPWPRPSR